jgi:hypothetical protein
MNQRRISSGELSLVLQYGRWVYRAGMKFIFLGHRDLPARLARQYDYLIGTTVLTDGHDVITVYKNRSAIAVIKRKSKRDLRKRW